MALTLHTIKPARGSKHKEKRVGRGNASGHGTFSTRGIKGQRARTSGRGGLHYKGMKAMIMSIPKKRGFRSLNEKSSVLNIRDLDERFDGGEITPQILREKKLVGKIKNGVKILGSGKTNKKFIVKGCEISAQAKEKIEKAGGIVK